MKPMDLTKFRKSLTKSIEGLSVGFNDPTDWISTGNYTLNYLISGNFKHGFPLGKVAVVAGAQSSGKSLICAGNVVRNAQEQGIFPIIIDTENALDEQWLIKLGVNTSDDQLLKLNMAMIDDVAKTISEFMKEYRASPDKPKVLFVIDSLGMLLTPTDQEQFNVGNLKGDLGRRAKALTALIRNCVNMFGAYNIGMICTNHTYASMELYSPDKISGGQGQQYAASIVVTMNKTKLREDEEGTKTSDVRGIRTACMVEKTRFTKPFESVKIDIPYDTGMNPYSGLPELFEKLGILTPDGRKLRYDALDGAVYKFWSYEWNMNKDGLLDLIMDEMGQPPRPEGRGLG